MSVEEVLEEVGTLIAGVSPWHCRAHGAHLVTHSTHSIHECYNHKPLDGESQMYTSKYEE